ncbi:amidohydrolase [Lactiplantibacillus garii]|uniref:Amidohydrolase n=1 Tax=Lactiplantibacillus garii TaxID=2306423 RepID=A0A3R8KZY2_9LACO|nr:amidohydrolase family protein [Lactiplantibacillus garii]RRK09763.1 amidohydrolase [Lactiplantibacillus garii]
MTLAQAIPIDVFAHVLAPRFYQQMLAIEPSIPDKAGYVNNRALVDCDYRRQHRTIPTHQIISMMNLNPEDYVGPKQALALCRDANQELADLVKAHADQFSGAVAMVPMNNLFGAQEMLQTLVKPNQNLVGVQLFTRALGRSIADPTFDPLFATAAKLDLPIWLHPVFDDRKPDNNIVFSWEYELTQAMHDLVVAGVFQRYPHLKIIVHHAGAMVPFFAGRINAIMTSAQADDFHKFYVDTAILGNTSALRLTVDYFGVDHVLFGTDAPFGILPVGASSKIAIAIEHLPLTSTEKAQILYSNAAKMLGLEPLTK